MKVKKIFDHDDDNTITCEYEDGEDIPEYGDVLYFPNELDNGFRVGNLLYNKYNTVIYEIIERKVEGSYDDCA